MEHYIIDYLTDSDRAYADTTGATFLRKYPHNRYSARTKDEFIQFLKGLNTNTNVLCLTIFSHGVDPKLGAIGIINDDQKANLIRWRELLDICNQVRTINILILNVLQPCYSRFIMDSYNAGDLVDSIWFSQDQNGTVNHALRAALEFGDLSSFIDDVSQDEDVGYIEYRG